MTPEAAAVLNEQMELSRNNTLGACWRRLFSVLRWWNSRGRGLEDFFTVYGFMTGLAFRDETKLGLVMAFFLRGVRARLVKSIGPDHVGWLQSSMVAWFVTGHIAFCKVLFDVASQPVEESTEFMGRIWQARHVLNSCRVRHPDLADQLAELEALEGRPLVPIGELAAMHGAA
jgi:hypothetical protein